MIDDWELYFYIAWHEYKQYLKKYDKLNEIIGKMDLENPIQKITLDKTKTKKQYEKLYKGLIKTVRQSNVSGQENIKQKTAKVDINTRDQISMPVTELYRKEFTFEYATDTDTYEYYQDIKNSMTIQKAKRELQHRIENNPDLLQISWALEAQSTPIETQTEQIDELLLLGYTKPKIFCGTIEDMNKSYEGEDLYESIGLYTTD